MANRPIVQLSMVYVLLFCCEFNRNGKIMLRNALKRQQKEIKDSKTKEKIHGFVYFLEKCLVESLFLDTFAASFFKNSNILNDIMDIHL